MQTAATGLLVCSLSRLAVLPSPLWDAVSYAGPTNQQRLSVAYIPEAESIQMEGEE